MTRASEQASGFLTPQILFILLGTMKRGYFDQNFSNKLLLHTFAVAVFNSELRPTWTFIVIHQKFSPWSHIVLGLRLTKKMIKIAQRRWGYFEEIIFNANKTAFGSLFCFSQAPTILSHIILRLSTLLEDRSQPEH